MESLTRSIQRWSSLIEKAVFFGTCSTDKAWFKKSAQKRQP
jgi:hypothetical protein